jgi:hypothetical protein
MALSFASPARPIDQDEVDWFVGLLDGRDWVTATAILEESGAPVTDAAKRRLRLLANQSGGRVAGGQKGYKLVVEMTADEFGHFERWMASQIEEMTRRRIEAAGVFHRRTRV